MTFRPIRAIAILVLASFAAPTPGIAKSYSKNPSAQFASQTAQRSDPTLNLAMGPTSAPQKPGGPGEPPTDTPPRKASKHKQRHS